MDWADEIAGSLASSLNTQEANVDAGPFVSRIATALRKAKADGARVCAQFIWDNSDDYMMKHHIADVLLEDVKVFALEIEKGNS